MPLPPHLPDDLPVPLTTRVLRPRSQRPKSSGSHGSSLSGNGVRTAAKPNMATNPNNPTFPGSNGLIGPGRSAETPASSSSRAMNGEDVNQWWGSYPASYVAPLGATDFGSTDDRSHGHSIHYPSDLNSTAPYTYDNYIYQNTSDAYGQPHGWEEPFRGFAGPSVVGSGESSLAGALGERKKRKREDPIPDPGFYPSAGPSYVNEGSSTGFSMDNNWVPPYAGPSHLGSHFDYREPSGLHSGGGLMDNRYFDEGLLYPQFSIHDADVQAPTGETNSVLTTHASDATGKLFYTPLSHSFTKKNLFTPEPDRKGKGKAREPVHQNEPSPVEPESPPKQPMSSTSEVPTTISSKVALAKPTKAPTDPLSDYTCPICFSPPTNATITPCGHICCGSCLFAAVKAGIQRSGMEHHPGGNRGRGAPQARYVLFFSFALFVLVGDWCLMLCCADARFVVRLYLVGMEKEEG